MSFFDRVLGWLFGPHTAPPPAPPTPDDVAKIEARIVVLVNQERARRGKPSLAVNSALTSAAMAHVDAMAERGELSHQLAGEPPLQTRVSLVGYRWDAVAENVAEGQPTAEAAVASWVASPAHLLNIIGPFADTGVGVAADNKGRLWFCQVFGDPA